MSMRQVSKRTTIYDIAKAVGTSAATVSRVLSNSGYPVSDEIRRKILHTANEMNYSPNMVGRMLKKSETRDIGVIIPTVTNPFYTRVILGIEMEAGKRGYNVLLCNSFRNKDAEEKYIKTLYQKQVGGIIISSITRQHSLIAHLQNHGVQIVTFDQELTDLKCARVGFDFIKGAMMAVEYLIQSGHRNIAFAASPLTKKSRADILEGYRMALFKHGIQIYDDYIIISEREEESTDSSYEFENGRLLASRLIDIAGRPTAVMCVNDMTAYGIIQELVNRGIRVPDDISVIGYDNLEFSSMVNPPLTTVNQPSVETGIIAARLLIDRMEGRMEDDICLSLEPSLILRNSVKNIQGRD